MKEGDTYMDDIKTQTAFVVHKIDDPSLLQNGDLLRSQSVEEGTAVYKAFKTKKVKDVQGNEVEIVDENTVIAGPAETFTKLVAERQKELDEALQAVVEINKLKSK